ncbi:MAG: Bax inhibitor-1/YccA family protein [Bacteroidota bacterium]|nr:Bax inhibitor-1/YccA family protein [Bacteroidota bacterium]
MRLGKSSNPAIADAKLRKIAETREYTSDRAMTIDGTLNKTLIMFGIILATGYLGWTYGQTSSTYIWTGLIGGLILAFYTIARPHHSPYTAPVYAAFEGLMLGAISGYYEAAFNGIVMQAVGLTLGIFFVMLFAYRSGTIRATPKFRRGMMVALGGVIVFYVLNLVAGFFGGGVELHSMGWMGIGIQLVIVGIASLMLILDFDNIEKGAKSNLPKFFEWYFSFGLVVTLVWLYLEILRLLSFFLGSD